MPEDPFCGTFRPVGPCVVQMRRMIFAIIPSPRPSLGGSSSLNFASPCSSHLGISRGRKNFGIRPIHARLAHLS